MERILVAFREWPDVTCSICHGSRLQVEDLDSLTVRVRCSCGATANFPDNAPGIRAMLQLAMRAPIA